MRKKAKVALGLSGGGFGGYLFEVGALTALDDAFDSDFTTNDFDCYIGVSAGSAAAALLANGVRPEEIFLANLSGEQPYYFESRDIFAPAMSEGLKTFWRAAQQFLPLLTLFYRNRKEMSLIDLLDKAQDALPSGVYTLNPYARFLEAAFTAKGLCHSFEGLQKDLYIPAIDLETGQTVIFGDCQHRNVPLAQAICASSAAPIFFCPVKIQGRDYIDGGVGYVTFFDKTIWQDIAFMVLINPSIPIQPDQPARDMRTSKNRGTLIREKGFLSITDQASRINFNARFFQALQLFREQHPEKSVFVITPKHTESLFLERSFLSFRDRVHLLRCGYESVTQILTAQFNEIHELCHRNHIPLSLQHMKKRLNDRLSAFCDPSSSSISSSPNSILPIAGLPSKAHRWVGLREAFSSLKS
jgi:NTE family protein